MKSADFVKQNNDFVVSETHLKTNVPASDILESLRMNRTTGAITFQMIEGGIRSVTLVERRKTSHDEREQIREILNIV